MSIAQRLQLCAASVDARLETLFTELGAPSAGEDGQWPGRLASAVRHAAFAGGKRIRPFLIVESAALFGLPPERCLDAAAAIECVHCYSLAHDDLPAMDNDETRRGAPTVWRAFDEWTAILAGDALQTLAFEILARPETHPDPAVRIELCRVLARASGAAGMAGGQALDLAAGKLGDPAAATAEHVMHLQAMKTGALITAACVMGAVLGGATEAERAALAKYGEALGLAFQISDDLLDAEGDEETVGKKVAKDAAAGKATLVSLIGIASAREKLSDCERRAEAALSAFGSRANILHGAARFVAHRTS